MPVTPDFSIDIAAVLQAWLAGLRASVTDPKALLWWPTVLTALVEARAAR